MARSGTRAGISHSIQNIMQDVSCEARLVAQTMSSPVNSQTTLLSAQTMSPVNSQTTLLSEWHLPNPNVHDTFPSMANKDESLRDYMFCPVMKETEANMMLSTRMKEACCSINMPQEYTQVISADTHAETEETNKVNEHVPNARPLYHNVSTHLEMDDFVNSRWSNILSQEINLRRKFTLFKACSNRDTEDLQQFQPIIHTKPRPGSPASNPNRIKTNSETGPAPTPKKTALSVTQSSDSKPFLQQKTGEMCGFKNGNVYIYSQSQNNKHDSTLSEVFSNAYENTSLLHLLQEQDCKHSPIEPRSAAKFHGTTSTEENQFSTGESSAILEKPALLENFFHRFKGNEKLSEYHWGLPATCSHCENKSHRFSTSHDQIWNNVRQLATMTSPKLLPNEDLEDKDFPGGCKVCRERKQLPGTNKVTKTIEENSCTCHLPDASEAVETASSGLLKSTVSVAKTTAFHVWSSLGNRSRRVTILLRLNLELQLLS